MRELLLCVVTFLCLMRNTNCQTYCICDVIFGVCEAGCCCDTDCGADDISTFTTCRDDQYVTVEQRCTTINIVFVNNAFRHTLTFDGNQSCVTADNAISLNRYKQADCTNEGTCTDSLPAVPTSNAFSETDLLHLPSAFTETDLVELGIYKSGSPIIAIYNTNITGLLTMPSSFSFSSFCHENSPVRYLHNSSSSCIVNMESLSQCNDINLLKSTHYMNSAVLSQLRFLSEFYAVDEGLLNVTTNCVDELTGAATTCGVLPSYDLTAEQCGNAVKSVTLQFETDGTSGIMSANSTIVIGVINQAEFPFSSTFNVNFVSIDVSTSVDGIGFTNNLGYISDAPIVANGDYLLSLTGISTDNTCTSTNRLSVLFKRSARTSCMTTYSPTDTCTDIQSRFLTYLKGSNFPADNNLLVPTNRSTDSQLIAAFVAADPVTDALKNVSAGCSNIAVGATYTILYTQSGSVGNSQLFLSAISLRYTTRDVTFTCLGGSCKTPQSNIELVTSVEFVDISESVTSKVASKQGKYSSFFWPIYLSVETTVSEIFPFPYTNQATISVLPPITLMLSLLLVFLYLL